MTGDRFTVDPNLRLLLADLGIPAARVLRRAALPGDLFARGAVVLTTDEYYAFWAGIEAEGAGRSLAVEIGRAISVEMFVTPIFAALCSPNLAVAAERIAAYKPLIGPMRLELDRAGGGLSIVCLWPAGGNPPRLLASTELVFWTALARIATRAEVRPVRVTMPELPADREALRDYLGDAVRKREQHAIAFSAADSARPFLTENEPMWRFFAPELRRRLADLEASATVADRVRAALVEALPAGDGSMAAVTAHLAVSPRTLQRQLQREGTSFEAVLAGTREQLARHYLAQGSMRTVEIAYLLGYDDANSFYRAFRSWTGMTPDAVRATAGAA